MAVFVLRACGFVLASFSLLIWCSPISAQAAAEIPQPDSFVYLDSNSIDLATGHSRYSIPIVGVGNMQLVRQNEYIGSQDNSNASVGWRDNWEIFITRYPSDRGVPVRWTVWDGLSAYTFRPQPSVPNSYLPEQRDGSSLTLDPARNRLVFTDGSGTVIEFPPPPTNQGVHTRNAVFKQLPSGERFDFYSRSVTICYVANCSAYAIYDRRQAIVSNLGWYLKFHYARNSATTLAEAAEFVTVTEIIGANMAHVYCNPAADTCSIPAAWPRAGFSFSGPASARIEAFTDPMGQVHRFTRSNGALAAIRPAGQASDTIAMSYTCPAPPSGNRYVGVCSVTAAGQTWTYRFSQAAQEPQERFGTITAPDGSVRYIVTQLGFRGSGRPITDRDPLNRTTSFQFSAPNVITKPHLVGFTLPESNNVQFTYDVRGNLLERRVRAKAGSGLADLVTTANYPASCSNPRTCNRPNYVIDARNGRTDFTYDATHGGSLTETGPTVSGIRPQTRHTYAQRYAWIRNSSGTFVQAATPVWVLTATSICRTSAATGNASSPCATAGDEVRTTYDYGPNSGPNNLLLRGQVVTADGVSLRTCYRYDQNGRRISETQPAANLSACP